MLEVSIDHNSNGDHADQQPKVNWKVVTTSPFLKEYSAEVGKLVCPLIGSSYYSITQIEREIQLVTQGIPRIAIQHLPVIKSRGKSKQQFSNRELCALRKERKKTWH